MACDFSGVDKFGTKIRCAHNTWLNHIVAQHLEMAGQQSAIMACCNNPYQVYQSGRYPQRLIYYKPFALPKPFDRYYLLVVVEYSGSGARHRGKIVTAFASANIKRGDILIWSI
jgi:hypothetical protein